MAGEDRSARPYALVVFGATGFTGQRVAKAVDQYVKTAKQPFKWAVAGRDRVKLEAVAPGVDIIMADVRSEASLISLAASADVLLDCVGPFRFFGEPVVKACIAARCNYVDITGEPEFMERIEHRYHDKAQEAGVCLIPSCGFDSVPADLGALFAVDTLRAAGYVCTAVEEVFTLKSGAAGMAGHYATYESAVHGIASASALRRLRKDYAALNPVKVITLGKRLARHDWPFWLAKEGRYAITFPGSDASVVRRSQRLLAQGVGADRPIPGQTAAVAANAASMGVLTGQKVGSVPVLPIQFGAYFTVPSWWSAFLFVVYGGLVSTLAQWGWGRSLLLSFPRLFTKGMFSHEGPSQAQMDSTSFLMNFYAKGYTREKLPLLFAAATIPDAGTGAGAAGAAAAATTSRAPAPEPEVEAVVRVAGPEPGYVATPKLLLACALTILEERATMPKGGVFTPAAAFGKTGIIERCKGLGIEFSVVEQPHKVAAKAQ